MWALPFWASLTFCLEREREREIAYIQRAIQCIRPNVDVNNKRENKKKGDTWRTTATDYSILKGFRLGNKNKQRGLVK